MIICNANASVIDPSSLKIHKKKIRNTIYPFLGYLNEFSRLYFCFLSQIITIIVPKRVIIEYN